MTRCFRKVTKKQKHVLINIHELSFYHSRNQSRIFFTCVPNWAATTEKNSPHAVFNSVSTWYQNTVTFSIYSSEFLSRMKHESGTETVGRRKTLCSGAVLIWCNVSNNEDEVSVLSNAMVRSMLLPSSPSSSFLVRSFHSLQVSWRWSWTADWCKTITGVWGKAWRTTNERPIASVFCWRGGAAVKRWVLTGRGYKWTKPKSDYSDYLNRKRRSNV